MYSDPYFPSTDVSRKRRLVAFPLIHSIKEMSLSQVASVFHGEIDLSEVGKSVLAAYVAIELQSHPHVLSPALKGNTHCAFNPSGDQR